MELPVNAIESLIVDCKQFGIEGYSVYCSQNGQSRGSITCYRIKTSITNILNGLWVLAMNCLSEINSSHLMSLKQYLITNHISDQLYNVSSELHEKTICLWYESTYIGTNDMYV